MYVGCVSHSLTVFLATSIVTSLLWRRKVTVPHSLTPHLQHSNHRSFRDKIPNKPWGDHVSWKWPLWTSDHWRWCAVWHIPEEAWYHHRATGTHTFPVQRCFGDILDTSIDNLLRAAEIKYSLYSRDILYPVMAKLLRLCFKEVGARAVHEYNKKGSHETSDRGKGCNHAIPTAWDGTTPHHQWQSTFTRLPTTTIYVASAMWNIMRNQDWNESNAPTAFHDCTRNVTRTYGPLQHGNMSRRQTSYTHARGADNKVVNMHHL